MGPRGCGVRARGLLVCREVRPLSGAPVVLLTAQSLEAAFRTWDATRQHVKRKGRGVKCGEARESPH